MLGKITTSVENYFVSKKNAQNNFSSSKLSTYFNHPSQPVWMKREYADFANAYSKNVIANRSISLIARSAASVEWQVIVENQYSGLKEIVPNHHITSLLKRPNPINSGVEFFENLFSTLLISGNAFVQMIRVNERASELHLLRPDRVTIISNGKTVPMAYKYKMQKEEDYIHVNQVSGLSDILHLKHFHPLDDYYGLSPMESAAYSIDQHNQAAKWNQSLLQNGARPSGALIVNSSNHSLSDSQFDRIKEQIEEQFSGSSNAGKPILLEGGLEWKEMSLNNKDIEFLETKNSTAREIALAFGVPPQLLGIPGDNTYSNLQEARLALWEETIFPLLDYTSDAINHWLAQYYKDNVKLIYNKDNISALSLRRESLWKKIEEANFLTVNEKREILGYKPIKGGDELGKKNGLV